LNSIRILVVDDERDFLDLVMKSLEIYGYETAGVLSGLEAIEQVRTFMPHLILLDVMMPNLGGIETLRLIREFDRDVKVVMISGMHDLQAAKEAINLGASDYVTKPFDLRELDTYIRNIVSSQG